MTELEIYFIPCLSDNYAYLLRDASSGTTAVVDPSEATPVLNFLKNKSWPLHYILNTHHHWDHTDGNLELKERLQCQVIGSALDPERIPGLDRAVGAGDTISIGRHQAQILETPGHTIGHICFWFEQDQALFCGDTLFTIGCGRLFEGTFEQMWTSLDQLRQLPEETQVFCGHEYTLSNGAFAQKLEPDNQELTARLAWAAKQQAQGLPTVPSTIKIERAINPFFRPESPTIQNKLGLSTSDLVAVFKCIRETKDRG